MDSRTPIIGAVLLLTACQPRAANKGKVHESLMLTDAQISRIAEKKIFFGHQSVGNDIIQGVRDWMMRDPRLKLRIVTSTDPQLVPGPALVESPVGSNRNPNSKDAAFTAVLEKGMGDQGGVAFYKYCYVDIDPSTDVQQMFQNYRNTTENLQKKYPRLKILHSTIPLTTLDSGWKPFVKTLLRRNVPLNLNAKRNQFNDLVRNTYHRHEPVFDLAEIESTNPDGSRSYAMNNGRKVYTLASQLSNDGGHLNEAGRRAAAERLLLLLSELE